MADIVDLAKVRELLEKATPGPWNHPVFGTQVLTGDSWNTICVMHEGRGKDHRLAKWEDGRGATDPGANAALIALTPDLARAYVAQADETKALKEALEWYGENARLCRLIHSGGDAGRHALSDDGGKRANAALTRPAEKESDHG